MIVYVAGPLFSCAERDFNVKLVKELREIFPTYDFILPQEEAEQILKSMDINDSRFIKTIYLSCINSINRCDVVLANLEGPDVDSGTAFEVGYAYGNNKYIISYRTDFRECEDKGVNAMLSKSSNAYIYKPFCGFERLVEFIAKEIRQFN